MNHNTTFCEALDLEGNRPPHDELLKVVYDALVEYVKNEALVDDDDDIKDHVITSERAGDDRAVVFYGDTEFLFWWNKELMLISAGSDGDVEATVAVVEEIQKKYKLKKPFFLSWANTASRMCIDSFGGGAVCVWKGGWQNSFDAKAEIMRRFREEHGDASE